MGPMNQLKGLMDSSQHPQQQKSGEKIITAPVNNWSGLISVPKDKNHVLLDGLGKKYSVRWDGRVVEDSPQEEGVIPETPEKIYSFQVKSREPTAVPITVKFF